MAGEKSGTKAEGWKSKINKITNRDSAWTSDDSVPWTEKCY